MTCSQGHSRQFFISAVDTLALAVHLSICCFYVILGSNVIPRQVGDSFWESECPFTWRCALCPFVARLKIVCGFSRTDGYQPFLCPCFQPLQSFLHLRLLLYLSQSTRWPDCQHRRHHVAILGDIRYSWMGWRGWVKELLLVELLSGSPFC